MAFREGLLQHIDLSRLLAQQAASAQEERGRQLQNELMKQEIQKNKDIRDLALGQGGIPYTSALSNSASIGYPEFRLEQERQKAFSQLSGQPLPTQGIVGYGGGGGRVAEGPSEAETRMQNAAADIAEEQARQAQYKRQGYGSAAADRLAEQAIESKSALANDRQYDQMIGDLRDQSRQRWGNINAGDKMISNTKSIGNEMKGEIDATRNAENKTALDDVVLNNKNFIDKAADQKSKVMAELNNFKRELAARKITPTKEIIDKWLSQF